jgi:hypothetical protein
MMLLSVRGLRNRVAGAEGDRCKDPDGAEERLFMSRFTCSLIHATAFARR